MGLESRMRNDSLNPDPRVLALRIGFASRARYGEFEGRNSVSSPRFAAGGRQKGPWERAGHPSPRETRGFPTRAVERVSRSDRPMSRDRSRTMPGERSKAPPVLVNTRGPNRSGDVGKSRTVHRSAIRPSRRNESALQNARSRAVRGRTHRERSGARRGSRPGASGTLRPAGSSVACTTDATSIFPTRRAVVARL